MTKFKDEEHKALMKYCLEIANAAFAMKDMVSKHDDLIIEMEKVCKALQRFSAKMIGK